MDSVSRPIGELKTDTDGVKASKYRIGYNQSRKKIEGRIKRNVETRQADFRIENAEETRQQDLEASQLPGQTHGLSNTQKLGFQYQSPSLGQIGFDALVRKPNEQTQE
jgi:uncharacterized protein (DUF2252 family)